MQPFFVFFSSSSHLVIFSVHEIKEYKMFLLIFISFPLFFIKLEQKQNISTFATLFYTIHLLHQSTLKLGFDDACTFMK